MCRLVTRPREGFALLAVLWILVGATALGAVASLAAREALVTSGNRIDLTRAAWNAEGCLERARSVISAALLDQNADANNKTSRWWSMDRTIAAAPLLRASECDISVQPAGIAVDINSAGADQLRKLFEAMGTASETADSLTDAVLDWRDGDDVPRQLGAETSWYAREERPLPRNAPVQSIREVRWIRGFEEMTSLDEALTVEPGRICLQHAPPYVLASLPGITAEAVDRILNARHAPNGISDLALIPDQLSSSARDSMLARFRDLLQLTVSEPEAWILISRARVGMPPVTSVIEVKLVRAGNRAAIVRRRTWTE